MNWPANGSDSTLDRLQPNQRMQLTRPAQRRSGRGIVPVGRVAWLGFGCRRRWAAQLMRESLWQVGSLAFALLSGHLEHNQGGIKFPGFCPASDRLVNCSKRFIRDAWSRPR